MPKPRKKNPVADQKPLIQIAMALLANRQEPAADKIIAAWHKLFPDQPVLSLNDKKVTSFKVAGASVMAAYMPVPVPLPEVLDALQVSWMWQRPYDAVRKHQAHVIVTALPTNDPVRDALLVTRLSAAVLTAGRGVALYWGECRQVHTPELVAVAASEDWLPVSLWVGITISGESESGLFSAATHGLEAFGHKEFEVLRTRMAIGNLRKTLLLSAANYVLESGPVLLDGQTCGPSADVRWRIRHAPSELVPGRQVIILAIP